MKHNGYSARIEYSDEDGCFVGHIAGICDVVGFHGEAVRELRVAFEEAVDEGVISSDRLQDSSRRIDSAHKLFILIV